MLCELSVAKFCMGIKTKPANISQENMASHDYYGQGPETGIAGHFRASNRYWVNIHILGPPWRYPIR